MAPFDGRYRGKDIRLFSGDLDGPEFPAIDYPARSPPGHRRHDGERASFTREVLLATQPRRSPPDRGPRAPPGGSTSADTAHAQPAASGAELGALDRGAFSLGAERFFRPSHRHRRRARLSAGGLRRREFRKKPPHARSGWREWRRQTREFSHGQLLLAAAGEIPWIRSILRSPALRNSAVRPAPG